MKKTAKLILILSCILLFTCQMVYADEVSAVMNAYTESDTVTVFVKTGGRAVDKVYLGNMEAKEYVEAEVGQIRTVIVLDNSLSINPQYRDNIKSFLTDLVAARNDGELFTIATFDQNITYLVQDSNDYLDIKTKIDGLTFENQDTYLSKVLYQVLDEISMSETPGYTRMVVIADGVDNEMLGYTDAELHRKIQAARVPIYTLGCSASGNEENLKRMFALSRLSNAGSYLLDNNDTTPMMQEIAAVGDITKVTIVPPDDQCDGTIKPVRIAFGEDYCLTELTMPFKEAVQAVPANVPDTEEETMIVPAVPAQTNFMDLFQKYGKLLIFIVPVIILLIAAVVVITLMSKKNRRNAAGGNNGSQRSEHTGTGHPQEAGSGTEILGNAEGGRSGTGTEIFAAGSVKVCLKDMDDAAKTFEYPMRDRVIIGKDPKRCQIVIDYDKYISSVHCEIIVKDGGYFVRDGGADVVRSTNGTIANGKKVAPEAPLPEGSILKIGRRKFKVMYR